MADAREVETAEPSAAEEPVAAPAASEDPPAPELAPVAEPTTTLPTKGEAMLANEKATIQQLRAELAEKEAELNVYIGLAADALDDAIADASHRQLRLMLASKLGLDPHRLDFLELAENELEMLMRKRDELLNLGRVSGSMGAAAVAPQSVPTKPLTGDTSGSTNTSGSSGQSTSDLTTAIANVNKVYDVLLEKRDEMRHMKAASEGATEPEALGEPYKLQQWDVLRGVMENPNVKRLLGMQDLSLPDCVTLVDKLFGRTEGGGGGKGGGGGGGGKGGGGGEQSMPALPPIDRGRFEKFFLVRHLGMLDSFLGGGKDGGKGGGGKGGEAQGVPLSQVKWQDLLKKVEDAFNYGGAPSPAASPYGAKKPLAAGLPQDGVSGGYGTARGGSGDMMIRQGVPLVQPPYPGYYPPPPPPHLYGKQLHQQPLPYYAPPTYPYQPYPPYGYAQMPPMTSAPR